MRYSLIGERRTGVIREVTNRFYHRQENEYRRAQSWRFPKMPRIVEKDTEKSARKTLVVMIQRK